jgi:hypothetical protein
MARRRLCILSRKKSLYSTSRLFEAAREQGAHPLVMDTLRCTMVVAPGGNTLLYRGVAVTDLAAVIPRIGASITAYGMAVVNHLETMSVPVVNPGPAIARSRDKLRCLQLLAMQGLDVPRTVMSTSGAKVSRLVSAVGGLPCIIKLLRGTQGVGVMSAGPFSARLLTDAPLPHWLKEPESVKAAARRAAELCRSRGTKIARLALQFALANPAIATTVAGSANPANVRDWATWAAEPIDAELLRDVQAIFAPVRDVGHVEGLPENN